MNQVVHNPNIIRAAGFVYRMRRRIATAAAIVLAVFLGYHVIVGQNGVTAYEQSAWKIENCRSRSCSFRTKTPA